VSTDIPSTETRPIGALAALTLVLAFPGRTFSRLVERPHWVLPLVFVLCAAVLSGMIALGAGFMDDRIAEEALRTGHSPEDIKAGAPAAAVVSGLVGVVGATLLQTLILMAIARLYGGRSTFRRAFSAVCHASVPIGLSAILMTALIPFVHRPLSGLNLSFLLDRASQPVLWGVASQLDIAVIWFFILLGIAARPVFELDPRRATATAVTFGAVTVLVLGLMSGGNAGETVDPYEGWRTRDVGGVTFHASGDAPDETLAVIGLVSTRTESRIHLMTGMKLGPKAPDGSSGPGLGRIECYLYPSVEEKMRVTGNPGLAHRVEHAGVMHLAWEEGAESAYARELLKLMDARAYGKVYTPLIRDGLAVCVGQAWAGEPVREAAKDLLDRRLLPDLDALVDAVRFVQLDEKLSQPAAGAVVCFAMDERGPLVARWLYEEVAGRSVPAGPVLEAALEDSLGAIERRWHEYLRAPVAVTAPDGR